MDIGIGQGMLPEHRMLMLRCMMAEEIGAFALQNGLELAVANVYGIEASARVYCLARAAYKAIDHQDIVSGCRYTVDGQNLLTWSHDGSVRLWDVELAREICVLGVHEDRVTATSLSPDYPRLARETAGLDLIYPGTATACPSGFSHRSGLLV